MPSFRVAARWVRNSSLPEPVRHLAFCWALESYIWLTGQKFQATYERLGNHFGFDWVRKPSETQLMMAIDVLERESERIKLKLVKCGELRRIEKAAGLRHYDADKYDWIYAPDFLEILPATTDKLI